MRLNPSHHGRSGDAAWVEAAAWRKSSHSNASGNACVEVAVWRKSSYSSGSGNACVEVAESRKSSYSGTSGNACVEAGDGAVLVRDTTDRGGATLRVSVQAWRAFASALR